MLRMSIQPYGCKINKTSYTTTTTCRQNVLHVEATCSGYTRLVADTGYLSRVSATCRRCGRGFRFFFVNFHVVQAANLDFQRRLLLEQAAVWSLKL